MRILAIDTSAVSCSVGILEDGRLLAEMTTEKKQTHSRHLMQMIDQVLRLAGCRLDGMDALAVVNGPGSFTGIRIGVSAVQGFALALAKPVLSVSSLEALAHQAMPASCPICPVVDARRGEVYAALYSPGDGTPRPIMKERVVAPERLLAELETPCVFIGSGTRLYASLIQSKLGDGARFAPENQHQIRAGTVGRIALQKIRSRETGSPDPMIPRYLRKSDAEIAEAKRKPAQK